MNADDCITVMKLIDVAIKQERKNFEMMFDGISSLIKKEIGRAHV